MPGSSESPARRTGGSCRARYRQARLRKAPLALDQGFRSRPVTRLKPRDELESEVARATRQTSPSVKSRKWVSHRSFLCLALFVSQSPVKTLPVEMTLDSPSLPLLSSYKSRVLPSTASRKVFTTRWRSGVMLLNAVDDAIDLIRGSIDFTGTKSPMDFKLIRYSIRAT